MAICGRQRCRGPLGGGASAACSRHAIDWAYEVVLTAVELTARLEQVLRHYDDAHHVDVSVVIVSQRKICIRA